MHEYPADVYPNFPEAQWKIEKLDLPVECYNALKRTGIEYIGDILDWVSRVLDAMTSGSFRMSASCYPIIFRSLLAFDNCPMREDMEKRLAKWDEQ